jgi:hypothetical protein
MSGYTKGPLTVRVNDCWSFNIETYGADGKVVFSAGMPCYGTSLRHAKQVIAGKGMPSEWNAANKNARAVADEVLRAAAPELLGMLGLFISAAKDSDSVLDYSLRCDAFIERALGVYAKATVGAHLPDERSVQEAQE